MLLCNSPACICLFQFIYFHFINLLTQYFLFLCYALGKEDTNAGKNGGGYIIPGIWLLKGGMPLKGDSSGGTGGNCWHWLAICISFATALCCR